MEKVRGNPLLSQGLTGPDGPAGKDGPPGEAVSMMKMRPPLPFTGGLKRCMLIGCRVRGGGGEQPPVFLCQPGSLTLAQPLGGNNFNEGSESDLFLLLL